MTWAAFIQYLPVVLPIAMIVQSFLASIIYGVYRDYSHMVYWGAAGVLTATVTYFK